MTFQTQELMDNRVLVTGSDVFGNKGQTTLDSTQWTELNARSDLNLAQQAFDETVEAFFAPLMEAAEKLQQAVERPTDSISYVVLDEGSEGEAARPANIVRLTRDSIILRLIEQGDTDRLVWTDSSTLEILKAASTPVSSDPAPEFVEDVNAEG